MPEAEKIQDDRLVPLDTSGESVDVELEESKIKTAEKEEANETVVQDDNVADDTSEESDVNEDVQASEQEEPDEHQDYSDKVQKRISKLVGKLREAERREQAAMQFAQGVQTKASELEKKYADTNQNYVSSLESESLAQIEEAKVRLKKAIEEQNVDVQAEAQSALAKATLNAERAKIQKSALEEQAQKFSQQTAQPQQVQTQQAPPPPPDPKATRWADENEWFGQDEAMTYTAFAIHRKLVEEEGYDPRSNDYYDEIDDRIREQFPDRFEAPEQPKKKVDQKVAPAVKSSSKRGKRTVRLTPSQVAIAKKLGVPLEEYAKYVKE
tara:strand:+ start:1530 stop:2504 length:975 start_codon:yes stop_codon:yes gene_type:complete